MKISIIFTAFVASSLISLNLHAQSDASQSKSSNNLYIDVHHLGPGKVTAKDVAAAHQKDLAVEKSMA